MNIPKPITLDQADKILKPLTTNDPNCTIFLQFTNHYRIIEEKENKTVSVATNSFILLEIDTEHDHTTPTTPDYPDYRTIIDKNQKENTHHIILDVDQLHTLVTAIKKTLTSQGIPKYSRKIMFQINPDNSNAYITLTDKSNTFTGMIAPCYSPKN